VKKQTKRDGGDLFPSEQCCLMDDNRMTHAMGEVVYSIPFPFSALFLLCFSLAGMGSRPLGGV